MSQLITPYQDHLVDGMLDDNEAKKWQQQLPNQSWTLTQRQRCDVECLLTGAFSPLTGFMNRHEYQSVLSDFRLPNDIIWPIPINLDVTLEFARNIQDESHITLRDEEGFVIAILAIEDCWAVDKAQEIQCIYNTDNNLHPGIHYLQHEVHDYYLGGKLYGLHLPRHYSFPHLRFSPRLMRDQLQKRNWTRVVGFQTRNPIHKAHYALSLNAMKNSQANLLLHPAVGQTMAEDIDCFTRIRCYEKVMPYYPEPTSMLGLCTLAMRMAGPREALWHGIIRRNYGCSHFIVGRDHAGVKVNGHQVYPPDAAQQLFEQHQESIGVQGVFCEEMVCDKQSLTYRPTSQVNQDDVIKISGTELRQRLIYGDEIPTWFTHQEVIDELKHVFPAKNQQGFTLLFTGLPSSGKSTLAKATQIRLNEIGGRQVTLLDGDVIRHLISSELGFTKPDRELNLKRITYIATEITKHRGIAICSAIAPYHASRQKIRRTVNSAGTYIEIYVSTPLEICEQRDNKGNYQRARQGTLKDFTGISDPYEPPEEPELTFDMTQDSAEECVQRLILYLESQGFI